LSTSSDESLQQRAEAAKQEPVKVEIGKDTPAKPASSK
jgi:hypothetical protein